MQCMCILFSQPLQIRFSNFHVFNCQLKLRSPSVRLLYRRTECTGTRGSDEPFPRSCFCYVRLVRCIKFHRSTSVHQDTLPWESFHSFLSSTSRRFRSRYQSCALKFPCHYGKYKQLACWASLYRESYRLRVEHVLRRFAYRRYRDHRGLRYAAMELSMLLASTELMKKNMILILSDNLLNFVLYAILKASHKPLRPKAAILLRFIFIITVWFFVHQHLVASKSDFVTTIGHIKAAVWRMNLKFV